MGRLREKCKAKAPAVFTHGGDREEPSMGGVPSPVNITVPLETDYLGLVTHFTEEGGKALGLGEMEAMRLTLASEEVFTYLARLAEPDTVFHLRLHPLGYGVRAEFRCPWREMDLRYFNLSADFDPEDEASLDQLGLVLAARAVDRFFLHEYEAGQFSLNLVKEKEYPYAAPIPAPPAAPLAAYRVAEAGPEQLKELAHLLVATYAAHEHPSAFAGPGKLVDMVAGGEYHAVAALGPRDQLGGALLWRTGGGATVRCYGPYLFGQAAGSPMAAELVDACLARIGKSEALSLLCRYPTKQLPPGYFEYLGELDYCRPDGAHAPWPHYYRQLHEDPGLRVWCHPLLEPFLQEAYDRLYLPRDIHLAAYEGEARPPHSVLGAHLDRAQGHVTLHPVWDGLDVADNLDRHVKLMRREGLANIFVAIDLGQAWQVLLTPVLLQLSFAPRLVMPYAGRADEVLFQHQGASA
jgi:hypothetical protein